MKKKYLFPALATVLMFSGCDYNEKYFDGLDEMTRPTNVFSKTYTLVEADYATISSNKANIALAKEAGVEKELGYVKNDLYLSEKISGATYIPAFLSATYYTADEGSSVKVTYNYKDAMSSLLSEYASVKYLKLTDDDYKVVYGTKAYAPYLSDKNESQIYKVLNENFKEAEAGTVVYAEYKKGEGQLDNPVMWEGFETAKTGDFEKMDGWFISSEGYKWKVASYDDNQYVQYSANGAKGECVAWMVSPAISVSAADIFSFDVKVGYYNANCLSVLVSENFDGKDVAAATWTDVTADFSIPTEPKSGYGTFASAGKISLSAYAGKKIYVAFKYVGDGANKKTTTYQIDNVMIGTAIPDNTLSTPAYDVKVYDGKSWKNRNNNVLVLTYTDYADMGQNKRYFTADVPAADYLPSYLNKMVAYPVDGDARVVIYRYYNGTALRIYSDEYVYSAETARWALNKRIIEKTEQFVLGDGKWNFDPSTVINLPVVKNDPTSVLYYQTITDWVKENHNEYVTSYGNNDYYFGGSAYQCNFDFRPSAWKSNVASIYGSMSDEELTKLMWERLPDAFIHALEALHADAAPVEGIDVIYTFTFGVYDGSTTPIWTIQYKVTGKGKFEYVEDSLKKVE